MLVTDIVSVVDFWPVHQPSPFTIDAVTGPQVPLSRVMDRARLGIPITIVVDSRRRIIAGAEWARALASIPNSEELIAGTQAQHYARTTSLLRVLDRLTPDARRIVESAQRHLYGIAIHVLRPPRGFDVSSSDLVTISREVDGL